MSNYPCSAVHEGSDPVGKSVLYFYIFYSAATLIWLGVSERLMRYKYVKVFFFWSTQSPSLMSPFHPASPSTIK